MTWGKIVGFTVAFSGIVMLFLSLPDTTLDDFSPPGFVSREYHTAGGRLSRYVLFVPREYDGSDSLPLIVFLHGRWQNGFDGRQPLKLGLGPEVASRHRDNRPFPFFVLFPQARSGWYAENQDMQCVLEILRRTRKEYHIDADRILLTGLADGARGAAELAATGPWTGLVLVSCDPDSVDSATLTEIPVRWYQRDCGDAESVRKKVREANSRGGSVELFTVSDINTDVWSHAYADNELYAWINRRMED